MRILWQIFAGLMKWSWRVLNFVREFILNLFLILLILICGGIYFQINSTSAPAEVSRGALKVDLTGMVVDKPAVSHHLSKLGRQLLGTSGDRLKETSLFDVVNAIRQAKSDSNITGLVLDLHSFSGADQPSLQYMGKALREFRDSGKPVYATSDSYSQAQYYLASFANTIWLSPQGEVDLHGFASSGLYYKSLLDKLKVNSHIFRVGTYKSAVEPFLRDDMSPAARDADSRWINQLWQSYIATIAANRQITPQQVFPGAQGVLEGLKKTEGDSAQYAADNKLVDKLASRSAVENALEEKFGFNTKKKTYNNISVYDYALRDNNNNNGNIAVIVANGAIMDGEEAPGTTGGDTTAAQLHAARLNDKIKAIILRVNSPGGSVSASEVIREELAAVRTAGKPVVVSMGGTAASGGYWISTPANAIIASPVTLTGSIGIFGVINTLENSLNEIGVHADGVTTSPLADTATTRALPPEVQQLMQLTIENGYKKFIGLVAQARNKTPQQTDQIAQGHVWTGSDAKANGLIDELGDFDDAVSKAAELADLKQYQLHWWQEEPTLLDTVLSQIDSSIRTTLPSALAIYLPASLTDAMAEAKHQPGLFGNFNDPQHRYALCLNCDVK